MPLLPVNNQSIIIARVVVIKLLNDKVVSVTMGCYRVVASSVYEVWLLLSIAPNLCTKSFVATCNYHRY